MMIIQASARGPFAGTAGVRNIWCMVTGDAFPRAGIQRAPACGTRGFRGPLHGAFRMLACSQAYKERMPAASKACLGPTKNVYLRHPGFSGTPTRGLPHARLFAGIQRAYACGTHKERLAAAPRELSASTAAPRYIVQGNSILSEIYEKFWRAVENSAEPQPGFFV